MKNSILLSFDIEEFDLAEEYCKTLPDGAENEVPRRGTEIILDILKDHGIVATFFLTANFAIQNQEILDRIVGENHEVASHAYYHSNFMLSHLKSSKEKLEEICGREVMGFRMPRMQPVDTVDIVQAGYRYDSSINPTCIPGRYNNFAKPIVPYRDKGLVMLPSSVTPCIRFPLFWFTFKQLPLYLFCRMAKKTLVKTTFLNFFCHGWEFAEIRGYDVPFILKRNNGLAQAQRFEKFLSFLKTVPGSSFCTMSSYVDTLQDSGLSEV